MKIPYLKTRNVPFVLLFILWCIALYIVFLSSSNNILSQISINLKEIRKVDNIFMVLSPLIALILTGILSSENKARIVFLRFRNALPGHRAFSNLALKDSRIDMDLLHSVVIPWPNSPETENRAWYAIYRKYTDIKTVQNSHQLFLLSRDLTSISFLFFIIGPWGLIFVHHSFWLPLIYAGVMFIHYILLMIVSRNHANRFVCNVLVEHSINSKHKSRGKK